MSKNTTQKKETACAHCGQQIPETKTQTASEEDLATSAPNKTNVVGADEALLEAVSKKAIAAVMEKVRPLLEKLQELTTEKEQQAKEVLSPEEEQVAQVKQMQQMAQERIKLQEQKVASKMKQLQTRLSGRV